MTYSRYYTPPAAAAAAAALGLVLRSSFDFSTYGNEDLSDGVTRTLTPTAGTVTAGVNFPLYNETVPTSWDLVDGVGMRFVTGASAGDWWNAEWPTAAHSRPDISDLLGSTPTTDTGIVLVTEFGGDRPSANYHNRGVGIGSGSGTWKTINAQNVHDATTGPGEAVICRMNRSGSTVGAPFVSASPDWIALRVLADGGLVYYGTGAFDWDNRSFAGKATLDNGNPVAAAVMDLDTAVAAIYASAPGAASYSPVITKFHCYEMVGS